MHRQAFSIMLWLVVLSSMPAHRAEAQLENLLGSGPEVETISVGELKALLDRQQEREAAAAKSGQEKPAADFVLVDVRSEEEVDVSVIPGAIPKAEYEANRDRYRGRTVIAYCTVGGRSARYASELKKSGVPVKNFKGSILQWVDAELPLVTLDGKSTRRVHTYSDRYKVPAKYEAVW